MSPIFIWLEGARTIKGVVDVARLNSRKYLNNRLQDDFTSVNLGGSDMRSGALAPVRQAERPAQRGRAREETSTIIWAARQVGFTHLGTS